jgi:DNA-binding SARP family transcriptional activator
MIYLAIENDRVHQREALMHLLWPAMPLKSAQGNLRQTIYLLRKALQDAGGTRIQVLSSRQTVKLNPEFRPYVDVDQFLAAVRVGSLANRREAADLYRGSFLSDFFLADREPFEI